MDKVLELIQSQMVADNFAIIGLSILLIVFFIQIYFYISYYNKPLHFLNKEKDNSYKDNQHIPSVSVIIVAKNESYNLKKNIPAILEQDYPNFEIIVVNDGSTDESQNYLEYLSKQDTRLYTTFLPLSEDKDADRRRILCMTLGIKAAKNEILLFTDAGATPNSLNWISLMVENLKNEKDIAIGYSNLVAPKSFWGRICSFDNLLFSLQYLSMAIKKKPFIGTYNNIAYRKNLFFDNKGFSQTLKYEYAEEVFLNKIMNSKNTVVVLNKDSFVKIELENYTHWKTLKQIYCRSKKYFKNYTPKRFKLESLTRYLIYAITLCISIYSIIENLWLYLICAILLLIIRNVIQLIVLKKASKHFEIKPTYLLLPITDLLQPFYNFRFKTIRKNK